MNVFSVFDGMSCGQIALNRINITYDNYFASEIDPHSIAVTQFNYPKTIQLFDITQITGDNLPPIDLFMGGSPCQSFSSMGDGSGFDGKSGLFFDFLRLRDKLNPKYFLLENVVMKKEWKDIITRYMGVDPIMINSNLLSAQNRKRLYWTNIPNVTLPEDKQIFIEDILDQQFDDKYWVSQKSSDIFMKKINFEGVPSVCCIDVYNKKYKTDRKSPTLTLPHHNSLRMWQDGRIRKLTPNECERLQTVPVDYTNVGITDNQRCAMIGNGWTVDVIAHILKNM